MPRRIRRAGWACALAFCLGGAVAAPAADDAQQNPSGGTATTCQCKACSPDVCCKAPTGFQPLDDKCKSACSQKTWTASSPGSCGTQPDCCK